MLTPVDSSILLRRLLDVTNTSRDAFNHAANAFTGNASTIFRERANDHERIAVYLREQIALSRHKSRDDTANRFADLAAGDARNDISHETPRWSLGDATGNVVTAILESRRAYTLAMGLAQRLLLERRRKRTRERRATEAHHIGWTLSVHPEYHDDAAIPSRPPERKT